MTFRPSQLNSHLQRVTRLAADRRWTHNANHYPLAFIIPAHSFTNISYVNQWSLRLKSCQKCYPCSLRQWKFGSNNCLNSLQDAMEMISKLSCNVLTEYECCCPVKNRVIIKLLHQVFIIAITVVHLYAHSQVPNVSLNQNSDSTTPQASSLVWSNFSILNMHRVYSMKQVCNIVE